MENRKMRIKRKSEKMVKIIIEIRDAKEYPKEEPKKTGHSNTITSILKWMEKDSQELKQKEKERLQKQIMNPTQESF